MKIEISKGNVILKDVLPHKASREYKQRLFKNVELENTGEFDEVGHAVTRYKVPPQNSELASEVLILGLIEKVTLIDGSEEKVVVGDQDWLDNLSEIDFNKLADAARIIKKESDENAKKS